jgi:hypothetical protein
LRQITFGVFCYFEFNAQVSIGEEIMSKYVSLKGFLRGLVSCFVAITVWCAWAMGYIQGLKNSDESMPLTITSKDQMKATI